MSAGNPLKAILITLHIADQQALFIMLAADGTINRMGAGSVADTDRDLFIGRTSPELFEDLQRRIGADLLRWLGHYADPSPHGDLCRLTVGFQRADGVEEMSHWQYGAKSQGPPPPVREFVAAAVAATDSWFQQQKQQAHRGCEAGQNGVPLCFAAEAPWRALVPESEFARRVELTPDQCVVDGQHFFIRGHIEIPIHHYPEPLAFSVWSSLSEASFLHMGERWEAPDRASDPPYFGWLCSAILVYPSTIHLKLSVQSRAPGLTPLFAVEPTEHPLALDQYNGISIERWHEIARQLLQA